MKRRGEIKGSNNGEKKKRRLKGRSRFEKKKRKKDKKGSLKGV